VAAGQVLRQVPPAGAAVEPNDIIVLTVAKPRVEAPVTVSVPEVVALPASEASAALQDAGLRVEIVLVPSSKAAGTVLSQTPAPGTALARSSLVSLEVARAQPVPVARIELPDLVGTNVADAHAQLRDLGLRVAVTRVAASQPADTVIRQAPRAGARLREGATVSLRVSTGPQRVSVPDVTGLDEETARMELENAGFDVRVTDESTTDPSEDGLVVRQTPLGGSNAPEGAIVTITVARLD
jgi:serine/threonine-protein kinase